MKRTKKLGKIYADILEKEFGKLQTDEIIVTSERICHIRVRHKEDYKFFVKYVKATVNEPDYIIRDGKNYGTVFMVRKLPKTNLNVVVRVALATDEKGLKNSVMTFYRLRDKNLKKIIENNSLLYKKE